MLASFNQGGIANVTTTNSIGRFGHTGQTQVILPITLNSVSCAFACLTENADYWNATVYRGTTYCTVMIAGAENKTVTGYYIVFGK